MIRSALLGCAGIGMLLLPACTNAHASAPANTGGLASSETAPKPAAAPASGERVTMPTMVAPAEPPKVQTPDAAPQLPALPAQDHASTTTPGPTPAAPVDATPAPAAVATAVSVTINDELPFLAVAAPAASRSAHAKAADDENKKPPHKKHHVKKLPPGTTSEHTETAHRRRGHSSSPAHPDPRLVVDITQAAGGANQAEVQRTARAKGYNVFRRCYEEGLRRNQHLSGKLTIDFTLGAEGNIVGAHKTASTIGDDSVNQCVVREAGHLVLAKPDAGTPAITMAVTLSPGDEPVPVPHAAPHADKLRDALRSKWSGVEVCYKQGLERRADLGGRMELRFRVRPNGEILEAAEADEKFADVEVTKCVLGVYRSAKLPKIGKKETQFIYALHLEAVPREVASKE